MARGRRRRGQQLNAIAGVVSLILAGCSAIVPASSPPPGYGPATWALDPDFADPGPQSEALHILVWERACNGGTLVFGRMSAPAIAYGAATVTVTMEVRGLAGLSTCPLGPGTPLAVQLREPLGDRILLDGGREPPSEPSPP